MLLETNQIINTTTGRSTIPFPKVDISSERKTLNTTKRVDKWLINEAIIESEYRNDEYCLFMFKNMNPNKLSQTDKDSAHYYCFGDI